jgi:hypothetical protein
MEDKKMKLSKVVTLGAATLIGFNALKRDHEESEHKHEHGKLPFKPAHIALYTSLFATGLAIWDMKKHHHAAA